LAVVWEGRQEEDVNVPQITAQGVGAYGDIAAGPIWRQIIEQSSQALHLPVEQFTPPPGIVTVKRVSITSGQLAGPLTPSWAIQSAQFIAGTQPTSLDPTWIKEPVLARDPHKLWEPGCGPEVMGTFLVPPSSWKPGMPAPLNHIWWPPTATCNGTPTPPPPPPGNNGGGNNTTGTGIGILPNLGGLFTNPGRGTGAHRAGHPN
jgi:penicillin-binding protein 1A